MVRRIFVTSPSTWISLSNHSPTDNFNDILRIASLIEHVGQIPFRSNRLNVQNIEQGLPRDTHSKTSSQHPIETTRLWKLRASFLWDISTVWDRIDLSGSSHFPVSIWRCSVLTFPNLIVRPSAWVYLIANLQSPWCARVYSSLTSELIWMKLRSVKLRSDVFPPGLRFPGVSRYNTCMSYFLTSV